MPQTPRKPGLPYNKNMDKNTKQIDNHPPHRLTVEDLIEELCLEYGINSNDVILNYIIQAIYNLGHEQGLNDAWESGGELS